ncbi:MAG: hypothetical protein PHC61_09045, partial [Chitinivibrionales bacterium]|nr:hypothetical protein [Chitinivibrionales bacterium]
AFPLSITDTVYEDRAQFKITTQRARYFYDKNGGAFSRILDSEGKDWVHFKKDPLASYPLSGAAGYRGVPDMFGGTSTQMAGSPGWDNCASALVNDSIIETTVNQSQTKWRWVFTETYATMTMLAISPARPYRFFYGGPPADHYATTNYYGTDSLGYRTDRPVHNQSDVKGNWRWWYVGDRGVKRVFFMGQHEKSVHPDMFGFMDATATDGMAVLSMGRTPDQTIYLTEVNNLRATFSVGFIGREVTGTGDHALVADSIAAILDNKQISTAAAPRSALKTGSHPLARMPARCILINAHVALVNNGRLYNFAGKYTGNITAALRD